MLQREQILNKPQRMMSPNLEISNTKDVNPTICKGEKKVSDMKSLIENCLHCTQNIGIELFYVGKTREYHQPEIYGHYEKKSKLVNARTYFKKGRLGIWWNGEYYKWNFGLDSNKGSSKCYGYFLEDASCPHKISKFNAKLTFGKGVWRDTKTLALRSSFRGKKILNT